MSFARGLNDTQKIAALAVLAGASIGISAPSLFIVGAMVMGAGSLIAGGRVTRTLAERVTDIDPLEGLAASAVAAALVLAASIVALPVSTTHVASGAIVGAGLRAGSGAVHLAHGVEHRPRVVRDPADIGYGVRSSPGP